MGTGTPVAGRPGRLVPAGPAAAHRAAVAAACACALLLGACAAGPTRYPGRADVRAGDAPVIRIEETNSTDTSPRVLRVPPGTDVSWLNASGQIVFVRFVQPVREACGEPVRFDRNFDGTSYVTRNLAPFNEARLCFPEPGRYDFVVSSLGGGGGGGDQVTNGLNGSPSPVRYGTVIVE
ncbi:MAG TPA: hypothetical protein VF406_13085 [Thermodesulfobacteriota bacterium]